MYESLKPAFTMRKSYCDVYNVLKNYDPIEGVVFMSAIIDYGLYGIIPDKDDIVWKYGMSVIFEQIDEDKERFKNSPSAMLKRYYEEKKDTPCQ